MIHGELDSGSSTIYKQYSVLHRISKTFMVELYQKNAGYKASQKHLSEKNLLQKKKKKSEKQMGAEFLRVEEN